MPTDPNPPSRDPHSVPGSNATPASDAARPAEPELFSFGKQKEPEPGQTWMPWAVAAAIVLACLGLLAIFGGGHPVATSGVSNATLQASAYAANLQLSDLHMSQAENFAGSQVTYVDGTLANHGNQTVTGVTVAVTFANDTGDPPQVETLQLVLIRMHQPYIDTEPVSAAPLAPGATREFRLVFDDISPLWNMQVPEVRVLGVQIASNAK